MRKQQGGKTIQVHSADTDVVAILVGTFYELAMVQPLTNIWVAFCVGKKFRYYHINAICNSLGEEKSQSRALPVFHSFTGCDTTSAFNGKGKKSAWQAWQAYEDVTEAFVHLALHPFKALDLNSLWFQKIERLTVILYDKTCPVDSVNEARKELFCVKKTVRWTKYLPHRMPYFSVPTVQCTKLKFGLAYRPSKCFLLLVTLLGPTKLDNNFIAEVSKACRQLIKGSCNGQCCRCKCTKANLQCSPLCNCKCKV